MASLEPCDGLRRNRKLRYNPKVYCRVLLKLLTGLGRVHIEHVALNGNTRLYRAACVTNKEKRTKED
jgi:hypothetical protein